MRPGGFLDALAEAVSPLCGLDPEKQPGRLKTLEDVRKALEGADSLGRLAGQISHAASLSAARVAFEAPLDITLVPEGPAKKLILEAIQKEKEASGPVGKAIPPSQRQQAADTQKELQASGPFWGAKFLHGHGENVDRGLHPIMWGISKAQFALFLDEVKKAHAAGKINNHMPDGLAPYPDERFESPEVGPNMHQVNMWVIKKATAQWAPLPGISYALKCNLSRGGLRCSLFISHSWDEGLYALGPRILAAWPDDCEGAFIACLSMPQNFEVGKLIALHSQSSESVAASPFSKVLLEATPKLKAFVTIVSPATSPMSRLWCAVEALLATNAGIASVTAEGATSGLLRGNAFGEALIAAEEAEAVSKKEMLAASATMMELGQVEKEGAKESALRKKAERRMSEARRKADEAASAMWKCKLDVLVGKSSELLELELATCTIASDRAAIKEHFKRQGIDTCRRQIASLVRKSACGMTVSRKDASGVEGALGNLSLSEAAVALGGKGQDLRLPASVVHLAAWLWQRPRVAFLDLSACKPMPEEVPRVVCAALAAGSLPSLTSVNVDGVALPVRELTGTVSCQAKPDRVPSAAASSVSLFARTSRMLATACRLPSSFLPFVSPSLPFYTSHASPTRRRLAVASARFLRFRPRFSISRTKSSPSLVGWSSPP